MDFSDLSTTRVNVKGFFLGTFGSTKLDYVRRKTPTKRRFLIKFLKNLQELPKQILFKKFLEESLETNIEGLSMELCQGIFRRLLGQKSGFKVELFFVGFQNYNVFILRSGFLRTFLKSLQTFHIGFLKKKFNKRWHFARAFWKALRQKKKKTRIRKSIFYGI